MKKKLLLTPVVLALLLVSCNKQEVKTIGVTSPNSDNATVIDGVVIDEQIPAYRIVKLKNENAFSVVPLNSQTDTISVETMPNSKQTADIFEGNIVRAEFIKDKGTIKKISFMENYDFTYTKFLLTVGGKWTSISNDTIIIRKNGSVYSNIANRKYDTWHIVNQPALNGINRIVLKRTKNVSKEVADTVEINMERHYLNFPDDEELSLKHRG